MNNFILFRVICYKYIKEKLRSNLIFLIILLWPCLLFFIVLKLGFNFGTQVNNKGFYHDRPLPSSGLGPYLFSIFCLTPYEVNYNELNKISFQTSRFKILFNFIESGYHNNNSNILMPELFTAVLKSVNLYKINLNKNRLFNINLVFSAEKTNIYISRIFGYKINLKYENDKDIFQAFRYWMYKSLELLAKILKITKNNEIFEFIDYLFYNNLNINSSYYNILCDNHKKKNRLKRIENLFESIPQDKIIFDLNSEKINILSIKDKNETLIESTIEQMYILRKNTSILFAPNIDLVRKIDEKYKKYFLTIHEIFEYLHINKKLIEKSVENLIFTSQEMKNNNDNIHRKLNMKITKLLILRIIKMLPIYTYVCTDSNDLYSRIHTPFTDFNISLVGFNFELTKNNEYIYDITFNARLVGIHVENWKHPTQLSNSAGFYFNRVSIIQDLIDTIIMEIHLRKKLKYSRKSYRFSPLNCYEKSYYFFHSTHPIPLILTISQLPTLAYIVNYLAKERNNHLFYYFKIININIDIYIFMNRLIDGFFSIFSMIPVLILLKYYKVITYTSEIILIFYIIFSISSINCLFCLVSNNFKNQSLGMIMGIIVLILGCLISTQFRLYVYLPNTHMNTFFNLFCHLPLCRFFDILINTEYLYRRGVNYKDIFYKLNPFEKIPLIIYFLIMITDGLIYYILEILISKIALCKPFMFMNNLFSNSINKITSDEIISDENKKIIDPNISILIENIFVTYNNMNYIFQNLSLTLYYEKIYIILGENGSGKSTFIKTMLGILKPISGNIKMKKSKNQSILIGFCPQHDIIIKNLSVEEHFIFYFSIKMGEWCPIYKNDLNNLLKKIGLFNVKDSLAKNLSGGEKRKLSIGISIINKPDILILDEPTSSVDPSSRESIYDLIINNRKDRTIIITTHHVEEAEILGDEILFLIYGQFIKQGYLMELIKDYSSPTKLLLEFESEYNKKDELLSYIKNIYGCFTSLESYDDQLIIKLNNDYKFNMNIINIIEYIVTNKKHYNIKSMNLNDSTLEEVFINIFKESIKDKNHNDRLNSLSTDANNIRISFEKDYKYLISTLQDVSLKPSKIFHIYILIKRRILSNLMCIKFNTRQFLIPMIIIFLGCFFDKLTLKRISQSHINHINQFSKLSEFIIPIYHDSVQTKNELNKVFLDMLNEFYHTDVDGYIKNISNQKNKLCEFENYDICQLNKISISDINKYASDFQILKNIKYPYYIQLIKNCLLDRFLLLTKNIYPYKRFFGIEFHKNNTEYISDIGIISTADSGLGLPLTINYINNIVFKLNSIDNISGIPKIHINFNIKEYGYFQKWIIKFQTNRMIAIFITSSFILSIASLIVDPIIERVSGFKLTQYNLGINDQSYWISFAITSWIFYLISMILCLTIMYFMHFDGFNERYHVYYSIITFLLFGYGMIPFMFFFSFFSKSTSIPYIASFISAITNMFLIEITKNVKNIHMNSKTDNIKNINNFKNNLEAFLSFFPYVHVCNFLYRLLKADLKLKLTKKFTYSDFYSEWFALFKIGTIMLFLIIIKIFIVDKLNLNYFDKFILYIFGIKNNTYQSINANNHENDNINIKKDSKLNSTLIIENLNKSYISILRKLVVYACKNVSFTIRKNECFGLLGKNGAGKSTIFKMIVDEQFPSCGKIIKNFGDENIFLTYCPQTDNCDENMTPYDFLKYLCDIYGYKEISKKTIVNGLIEAFGLQKFTHYKIKHMSFGNRRKLSCAICAIGNPQLILLDEPTSGVDPSARYLIWNFFHSLKKSGKSILFTSHSMRECEIYGERIAIMIDGKIICIGSPEYVKERHGFGYELRISCSNNFKELVIREIYSLFPESKELYSVNCLKFLIPINFDEISILFRLLHKLKIDIPDLIFQINQSRLETVFSKLANN